MKRQSLYILALSVLALSGCQQNELGNGQYINDGSIKYAVALEHTSRGQLVNTTDDNNKLLADFTSVVSEFVAKAYDEEGNEKVSQTVTWTDGAWKPVPRQYWPLNLSLDFLAYANLPAGQTATFTKDAVSTQHSVPATAAAQTDILFGHYSGDGGDSGTAEVRFEHPLTSVLFKYGEITGNPDVKSITMDGVAQTGTASMTPAGVISWTEVGDCDYTVSMSSETALSVGATSKIIGEEAFLLIPQDIEDNKVDLTVVFASASGDVTLEAELPAGEWQQGMTNCYTLNFAGDSLHLALTVIPWNTDLVEEELTMNEVEEENLLLPGKFSVSVEEYIQFSRGNLQATYHESSSSYTWAFAENQYHFVGIAAGNTTIKDDGTNEDGAVVDLFGWTAANKYSDGIKQYGINKSKTTSEYRINSDDICCDWGETIDDSGEWSVLSGDYNNNGEWDYLLYKRTDAAKKWGVATVVGIKGIVILPDDWILPGECLFTPGYKNPDYYNLNVYNQDSWTKMEQAGAVFLPAALSREGVKQSETTAVDMCGYYWSRTALGDENVYRMNFSRGGFAAKTNTQVPYRGQSVRLVKKFEKPNDELKFVDLGLPSGTLWANMNLGAKRMSDYGDYYAWGATEPYYTSYTLSEPSSDYHTRSKTINGWNKTGGYILANAPYYSSGYTKYNNTDMLKTLDASDDAATQTLGSEYSTPTIAQFQELIDQCTWEHVVYEGVSAYKISGKKEGYKDSCIILPVCGTFSETSGNGFPRYARYWSSGVYYADLKLAQYFVASNEKLDMKAGGGIERFNGFPIRAVKDAPAE